VRVLLDTEGLTELRHPRGNPAVRAAIAIIPGNDLFLSVVVIAEISRGIALLANGRKKRALTTWLSTLESQFSDRILPVDPETAHVWGDICARVQQAGLRLPLIEGLLAATALRHGLYVMTRNTADMVATGVMIIDPWNDSNERHSGDSGVTTGRE